MGTGLGEDDGSYSWRQAEYYASLVRCGSGPCQGYNARDGDRSGISLNDDEDKLARLTDLAEVMCYP